MDIGNAEYSDRMILTLRTKYREKSTELLPLEKEIMINGEKVTLNREILFEGKCSILLPEIMVDMDYLNRAVRYRNPNRPPIIKTDYKSGAAITFSLIPMADRMETENISEQMEKVRSDIIKVWKQNVFYDRGEISSDGEPVVWMDYRAYCMDGNLYMILFMFQLKEQIVLGNFHCSFSQYDIWKPVIIKLLATIQKGGIRK